MDYYDAKRLANEAMEAYPMATPKQVHKFRNTEGCEGHNFMTPEIAGHVSLDNNQLIAEVSFGSGMYPGTYIFGVTVIQNTAGVWTKSKTLCNASSDKNWLGHYLEQLDSSEEESEDE